MNMGQVRSRGRRTEYAGIDWFRMAAALMVIAIHTAPFSGISSTADQLLTYGAGRVAVPFFLMTTGYFVLGSWSSGGFRQTGRVTKSLKKTLKLYIAAVILYLPVSIYAGNLPDSPGKLLKDLIFDGTFYHLWYFPAVLTGSVLLMILLRTISLRGVMVVTGILYLIGIGGDSWHGLVRNVPGLEEFYGALFTVSSYTRNGIFFAPFFLALGVWIRQEGRTKRLARVYLASALAASLCLMLAEGYISFHFELQRHNSMYLFLPPVMYCLFRLLLTIPGDAPRWTRDISMLVYIIHPAVLIVLRGAAGAAGLTELMVDNPMIQFLTVSAASVIAAAVIGTGMKHLQQYLSKWKKERAVRTEKQE